MSRWSRSPCAAIGLLVLWALAGCSESSNGGGETASFDQWTWMGGSDSVDGSASYGSQGIVDSANVPGARLWHAGCEDNTGNTWIFGGRGISGTGTAGSLNDLWKFDGGSWTWVSGSSGTAQAGTYGTKGTADAGNVPGSRYSSLCVVDTSGNLWLWGGLGYDSTGSGFVYLDDLWRFDGSQWTWVAGNDTGDQVGVYGSQGVAAAGNNPGGREGAVLLIDSNDNLWLFGGYGYDSTGGALGYLNDLWKYDGSQWAWVAGSAAADQQGAYGTLGVADAANVPGGRNSPAAWMDAGGRLWVFGGSGKSETGTGLLNDLWTFDGAAWAWAGGSRGISQAGDYGAQGTAAGSNWPGARYYAMWAADSNGAVWLFGGEGYDSTGSLGYLNDLWRFDGSQWTWISGADTAGQGGSYGTLGVAAGANRPGARRSGTVWFNYQDNLFLFGGGYLDASTFRHHNDLWRYQP